MQESSVEPSPAFVILRVAKIKRNKTIENTHFSKISTDREHIDEFPERGAISDNRKQTTPELIVSLGVLWLIYVCCKQFRFLIYFDAFCAKRRNVTTFCPDIEDEFPTWRSQFNDYLTTKQSKAHLRTNIQTQNLSVPQINSLRTKQNDLNYILMDFEPWQTCWP